MKIMKKQSRSNTVVHTCILDNNHERFV